MDNQLNSTQLTKDLDDEKMIKAFAIFLKTLEYNLSVLEGRPISPPPRLVRLETLGYTSPRADPLPSNAPTAYNTTWEMRNRIPTDISEELDLMESPVELEEKEEDPEYTVTPEEAAAKYTDTRPDCKECSGCRYCEGSDSYEGSDGYDP